MKELVFTDRKTGKPYSEDRQQAIQKTVDDLMSGAAFARGAMGGGNYYEPPLNRREYAHAIKTLAVMAEQSDSMCQIASGILARGLNPYGTRSQLISRIYDSSYQVLKKSYDDVIGRSGPDAGRYRDHQREFSLVERVILEYYLAEATAPCACWVPGVGWHIDAIARALGVRLHAVYFPSLKGEWALP